MYKVNKAPLLRQCFALTIMPIPLETFPEKRDTDIIIEIRLSQKYPDSNISWGQNGPTRVLSAPDGPHVGSMNLAFRVHTLMCRGRNIDIRNNQTWIICLMPWMLPEYFQYMLSYTFKPRVILRFVMICCPMIHSYPQGSLHWHWQACPSMPVKQHRRTWVNKSYEFNINTNHNYNNTAHDTNCVYSNVVNIDINTISSPSV